MTNIFQDPKPYNTEAHCNRFRSRHRGRRSVARRRKVDNKLIMDLLARFTAPCTMFLYFLVLGPSSLQVTSLVPFHFFLSSRLQNENMLAEKTFERIKPRAKEKEGEKVKRKKMK